MWSVLQTKLPQHCQLFSRMSGEISAIDNLDTIRSKLTLESFLEDVRVVSGSTRPTKGIAHGQDAVSILGRLMQVVSIVEPKFVGTLKGQGDTEQYTGITVPILVTGTFSSPKFAPDLENILKQTLEQGIPETKDLQKMLKGGEGEEDPKKSLEKKAKDRWKSDSSGGCKSEIDILHFGRDCLLNGAQNIRYTKPLHSHFDLLSGRCDSWLQ